MKQLLEKLVDVERGIAEEKGSFALFGLFLREDAPNTWDLIVSAPWFGRDEKKTLDYLAGKLQTKLKPDELTSLSRIVVVGSTEPSVKAIHRALRVEHGSAEVRDCNFFGLPIKHAYIITSQANGGAVRRAS
jgi:hypothetical protein